nr:Ran-binding protein 17 [Polyrhizophydium stewartii]
MDLINTANRGTLFRDELELSLIYFALQFKRSYLCDTGSRRAALFETVAQYCSISSQDQATISIFDKLLVNLRFATSSLVLEKTMEAFTDFTSGSVTSKMLKKSQVIIFLVQNHSSEHFSRITDQKLLQQRFKEIADLRVTFLVLQFFAGITKLLILESDESFDKELYIFLAPLQTNIEQYKGMSDSELLEPVRFAVLAHSLDDNVAALRFFHEFVWNKSGRLNFDVNSASGVVIFREVSQVANEIGLALIKSDLASIPESQYWPKVFKRISIILNLLKNILGGRYVCFGVFALYNDPVLANTLSVMFGLSRFIEARYLLASRAFLGVWAVFTGEQLMLVEDLDIETFSHVLECCNAAILDLSAHSLVSSQACTIIDNIFTHVCQRHIRGKAPDVIFARVQQTAHHCRALLATLFDKLVNEDPPNQWSMTRPLLPLVLLFSDFFQSYVEQLIAEQRSQNQEAFGNAILSVMEGVTLSLETRNRDRFTTNVSHVRRRILLEASSPS